MPHLDMDKDHPLSPCLETLCAKLSKLSCFEGYDFAHCVLEVLFVQDEQIREINLSYRGKDSTTDVLSFPLEYDNLHISESSPLEVLMGSIIINTDMAERVSKELCHSLEREISLLFIHGFLHILGFDHEVDNGEQRALEQHIIETLELGQSLIVRVQGNEVAISD